MCENVIKVWKDVQCRVLQWNGVDGSLTCEEDVVQDRSGGLVNENVTNKYGNLI